MKNSLRNTSFESEKKLNLVVRILLGTSYYSAFLDCIEYLNHNKQYSSITVESLSSGFDITIKRGESIEDVWKKFYLLCDEKIEKGIGDIKYYSFDEAMNGYHIPRGMIYPHNVFSKSDGENVSILDYVMCIKDIMKFLSNCTELEIKDITPLNVHMVSELILKSTGDIYKYPVPERFRDPKISKSLNIIMNFIEEEYDYQSGNQDVVGLPNRFKMWTKNAEKEYAQMSKYFSELKKLNLSELRNLSLSELELKDIDKKSFYND